MALEPAIDIRKAGGVDKDDLALVYAEMMNRITSRFVFRDLVNTQYSEDPARGGTISIKRMKSSVIQNYGVARTAGKGNSLQNNGVDLKIDTEQELAEQLNAKDRRLYLANRDALEILRNRQADFETSVGVFLEKAYFTALESTATAVDVSGESTLAKKLAKLIQRLGAVENEHVDNVDRELMVLTLSPEVYDALEEELVQLNNPITGRTDARAFRRVEVREAVRQTSDAVIQVFGSVAQPIVFDDFYVQKPELSNDYYAYTSFYFGTKAVMPDLTFKANLTGTPSV